jgi:sodium-dependent dicarboxylate transporter 2/3/5
MDMPASKKTGLIVGIVAAILILIFGNLDESNPQLTRMAAIAVLMAIWWITETIPLAATSLIPLIMFPFLGILNFDEIASSYINSIIFLFIGGFMIAIAMEEWDLHKRIALKIITLFGGSPNSIVYGFMISGAFLSMWISNTATAIMLLPIALAIINKMEDQFGVKEVHNFSVLLMLAVAYSCTLGGIGTLVGTPPNLVFVKTLNILYPEAPEISFGLWMLLCLPISLTMLFVTGFLLSKVIFNIDKNLIIDKEFIHQEYKMLGPVSFEEKTIGLIFISTALLWIFRADLNFGLFTVPGWSNFIPYPKYINDGTVAISMAFILFLIPSRNNSGTLLNNKVFTKIPWAIVLLFGGGFALAKGFTTTGLSVFIGEQLRGMSSFSPIIILALTATTISFLTELTSNTATTQMILPILASLAFAIGMHPLLIMITATLSASMAFMLPVATPPNTIIFASGRVRILQMARTGFALNIAGVITVTLIVYFLGDLIFDFNLLPAWAVSK